MIITRHHEVGQVPGVVEMNPTSLPELFKQLRTFKTIRKPNLLETKKIRETEQFEHQEIKEFP